jgi:predicted ATPase
VTPSGEDGYQFRHALLQEVLYASLLPGERTGLHAGYARALTEQPELADGSPAVAAAELAAHWDAAGDPAQALPAAVQAGLAAELAHAVPEAYRHYDRALRLWTRTPQAAALAPLDRVTLLERAAQTAHLVDVGPERSNCCAPRWMPWISSAIQFGRACCGSNWPQPVGGRRQGRPL